ncbi:MAG: hypothetical protein Q8M07_14370 [Prosthecobacter sp.]|nr:hypothetical protein [Prosthecobacter sp.]
MIATVAFADETLFNAKPLTANGWFTKGIEGPAVDREGFVYAVNLEKQHPISKVSPEGKGAMGAAAQLRAKSRRALLAAQ